MCRKYDASEPSAYVLAAITEFLDELDTNEEAHRLGLEPIQDNLELALKLAREVKGYNCALNRNPAIKQHFDFLFSTHIHHLGKRFKDRDGYKSLAGLPSTGNPILLQDVRDSDEQMAHLLLGYYPAETVLSWFTFRENLIFKCMCSEKVREGLQEWFGFV